MNPNIETLFAPKSVAVVGASNNPNKWGNWLAEQVLLGDAQRRVYLVNPKHETILGREVFSLAEIPERIDVAVVAVPDDVFDQTIDDLLAHKVRIIIAINVGFSELGYNGFIREQRITRKVRNAGSLLVGPNCAGVWDGYSNFRCLPIAEFTAGPVGFISQSGGLITDVYCRLKEVCLGFSRVISIGNSADLSVTELIENFDKDPNTKVIGLHIENESLIPHDVLKRTSKPVVLLTPFPTSHTSKSAKQHTNSTLSLSHNCTHTVHDFVASIQGALSDQRRCSRTKNVIVVTDSGGMGTFAVSAAEQAGLSICEVPTSVRTVLAELPRAVISNPVDLVNIPGGFSDITINLLKTLQSDKDIDGIILILFLIEIERESSVDYALGRQLAAAARLGDKPVVFVCKDFSHAGTQALLHEQLPVYRDVETAAKIMSQLCGC